jgi:hypothetical protein
VHDPEALANARPVFPTLYYEDDLEAAVARAELIVHVTEWQDYRELDPAALLDLVDSPQLLDARNALDPEVWRAAGWTFAALGRPDATPARDRSGRPILLTGWPADEPVAIDDTPDLEDSDSLFLDQREAV